MLAFYFDRDKTIQAAAMILKQSPRQRMKYILLLKMLYLADRESLRERLQPITGDAVYAMKHGPVLTHVKSMIDYPSEKWDDHIETVGVDVLLKKDPGDDLLSDFEVNKLQDVGARYQDEDRWEVVDLTHEFPEWKKHYRKDTSTRIPVDEIIDALGLQAERQLIEEEAEEAMIMAGLFGD